MRQTVILKEEKEVYSPRTYVDLKADFAFKRMFGQPDGEAVLVAFLNALLGVNAETKITSASILNTDLEREHEGDKKAVLDLLARTGSGDLAHVEIQVTGNPHLAKRQLYYWSRIYAKQMEKGRPYSDLRRTISILISNVDVLPRTERYHSVFGLYERQEHFPLTDVIELHVIELQKLLKRAAKSEADPWTEPEIRWLLLLGAVQGGEVQTKLLEKLEAIAMSGDSELMEAFGRWEDMSRDPKVWAKYEMWHKAMMDDAAYKAEMELLLAEQARWKAEKDNFKAEAENLKSEAENLKSENEQMHARLLETGRTLLLGGMDAAEVARLTGLSPDELEA
ncbi:Rpn family recombination-promoting nuclease/putative transposase [Cohnella ginsengisoli]|uniref:Rpn family recombination-promoting nuclease/putative transposase n=1 Tax=Cohnella ginsengisoli TaxID=425004 RepID=A0A9X4KF63_9BACL|nr:Rpn family recombination-promoting nuclease/putative transposase [Cohnella ginsengisoli]MDG0790888.1 Rpn family recombination-promoting nuclease/putative transposase [Cohnella ginsengisoli]